MRRIIVLLAAMAVMVVGYAGAALAASVNEVEPNDSLSNQYAAFTGNSQNIDASFSLDSDPNITDSTTVPHATILGTGNDTRDYYSFAVPEAGTGTIDVDGACCLMTGGFDSTLRLFPATALSTEIAYSDESPPDPGSPSECD